MIDTKESMTAKLCSFVRAYHSNFSRNKVFDDYLAYDFMGKDDYDAMKSLVRDELFARSNDRSEAISDRQIYAMLDELAAPIPLARIAFAEDELTRFIKDNAGCQYVICGAGMDTFAFRNTNPSIRIFEIDHPDTQRYKLQKISELEWSVPENVSYVPVDFSCDDLPTSLIQAGFDPKIPAFFSILGVTYYLSPEVLERTIADMASCIESKGAIVFDFPDLTTFTPAASARVKLMTQTTAGLGEPMGRGYAITPLTEMLASHGFHVKKHLDPDAIQSKFFTGRSDRLHAFENVHLMLAER